MRPLTYENAQELAFLKTVYSRQGSLDNTSFGILAPDGKTHLVSSARSPSRVFRDSATMAAEMRKISAKFPGKENISSANLGLPMMESVRFALNTAACDTRLLAIIHASDEASLSTLTDKVTPIAWSDGVMGHFLYASAIDAKSLAPIEQADPGILLVKPGNFGLTGTLIGHLAADATAEDIRNAMLATQTANKGYSKDSRKHLADAEKAKATWTSATPISESKIPRRRGFAGRRGGRGKGQGRGSREGGNAKGRRGETKKSGEGKGAEESAETKKSGDGKGGD